MNYYLLRQSPRQQKFISTCEAQSWDVVGIVKAPPVTLVVGLLYRHHEEPDMLFLDQTDMYTYDLMKAFGIICCDASNLHILMAQEISDRNNALVTTVTKGEFTDRPMIKTTKISGAFKGSTSTTYLNEHSDA